MNTWTCEKCGNRLETANKNVMVCCKVCRNEMKILIRGVAKKKYRVEVKE